ncbi:MAG: glutamine synthetase family protein [Chitinophagales bacterium]|nr:glutamine synthetase family protein [Chitinophagales bacterium]
MSQPLSEQAIQYVRDFAPAKVKLAVTDIDGILRGKVISRDKFLSIVEGGFGFCDVVLGWDSGDVAYDNTEFTGWHTGYPDVNAKVDLNTFRKVPWDNDIPFFLADFRAADGNDLPICPRGLLRKIRQQALDAGYYPIASQEFEWFNFEETPESLESRGYYQPQPMTQGMFGYSILRSSARADFFNDLFDLLGQFGVPIEGIHTETGPGVYEAAILYGDILDAGDRAVLFKSGVKEIGQRHGVMPSFMAKWNKDLPGCSGHIHQSLWDVDKSRNLFYDAGAEHSMSQLMRSYMAGLLYCLPHVLPMYAPTINSYKRLVEGAWAPTTPTWGMDNRTTALRALPGGEKSTRIETRVSGSDVNPYLALAASLASGLYGIRHNLVLEQPYTVGNGYADKRWGTLPRNLDEATRAMQASPVAADLFGNEFVKHFCQTREWEWRQYSKAVTDWELKRYFEII